MSVTKIVKQLIKPCFESILVNYFFFPYLCTQENCQRKSLFEGERRLDENIRSYNIKFSPHLHGLGEVLQESLLALGLTFGHRLRT